MNEMQSLQALMLFLGLTAVIIVAGTILAVVLLGVSERPKRISHLTRSVHDVGTLLHKR